MSQLSMILKSVWPTIFDGPFSEGREMVIAHVEQLFTRQRATPPYEELLWTNRGVGTTSIITGAMLWMAAVDSPKLIAYVGRQHRIVQARARWMASSPRFQQRYGLCSHGRDYLDYVEVGDSRIVFAGCLAKLRGVSWVKANQHLRTSLHLVDGHDDDFPNYLCGRAGLMIRAFQVDDAEQPRNGNP